MSALASVIVALASLFLGYPIAAQTVAPEVAAPTSTVGRSAAGTVRQQSWLKATAAQRVKLAEQLGDEGARAFAKAKAWIPVFDGSGRRLAQGPDQVYRGSDGLVHVVEAKGGGSQLGRAYGHSQASSEWAVEAAKKVLRHPNATDAERRGAKLVLDAAANGKLQVHVVRTSHALGEPTAAVLEQTVNCSDDAARLAQAALGDLAKTAATSVDDAARTADGVAKAAAEGSKAGKIVAKVALPVAVAVDAGFRVRDGVEIEQQFAAGKITLQHREVAHAANVAGMAGGWAGAWAGAELGAAGGAAIGTAVVPGPGTTVGAAVGGLAGGVAGYVGGEAAAASAAEWAMDKVHAAGTTVSETANSAAHGLQQAWNWARGY